MNSFKLKKKRKGYLLILEEQSTDSIRIADQNFTEPLILIENNSVPINLENCNFVKLSISHSSEIKIDKCRVNLLQFDECSQIIINSSEIEFLSINNCSKDFEINESTVQNLLLFYSFKIKVNSSRIQTVDNIGSSGCVFQDISIPANELEKLVKPEEVKLRNKKTFFMNFMTIMIFLLASYELIWIILSNFQDIIEIITLSVIGLAVLAAIFSILFIPFLKHDKRIKKYKKEQMKYRQNVEI